MIAGLAPTRRSQCARLPPQLESTDHRARKRMRARTKGPSRRPSPARESPKEAKRRAGGFL
jgi:hypothetical protein